MEKYPFERVLLIVPKLRKLNERKQGHYVSERSLLYNGGSRSYAGETVTSNGFQKRSPTTAATPGRGKHGKMDIRGGRTLYDLDVEKFWLHVYKIFARFLRL